MSTKVQPYSPRASKETVPKKQAVSSPIPLPVRPKGSVIIGRPIVWQEECPWIEIVEVESEYQVIVPLSGIDARNVYVFATARSLLFEIRFKSIIHHQTIKSRVTEKIDQRIVREFSLPVEIERGATTIQVCDASLLITARKSQHGKQTAWSQFVDFDARAFLGCG